MKHFNVFIMLGVLVVFASCKLAMPIYTEPSSNNKDYKISYLFEHDGCKVYRFLDGLNTVYFTSCRGETIFQQDSTKVIRNGTLEK